MQTTKIIDAIQRRLFWMKYGILFLRSSRFRIEKIKIGGQTVRLSVPAGEVDVMDYEFKNIFYDDCYGLRKIDGPVNTILDVGSNLGFFSMTARSCFPNAKICSYEPNPNIQTHLLNNTRQLAIEVHPEALGVSDGRIDLKMDHGSLFGRSVASATGSIKKTAIAKAIDLCGGSVDLLKLDCEGAEWELFELKEIWPRINNLTMEYHLWANPSLDLAGMVKIINNLGFRITQLSEAPELKWGMLQAVKIRSV
jgi:FkbM family methyltransferase